MIFVQSRLNIVDNSGALEVGCIHLLKESSKKGAKAGEIIVCSVKKNILKKKKKPILRGQVCRALIVSTKNKVKRLGNFYVTAGLNTAILVNDSGPLANRIFGPVFQEVRNKISIKVLSIAEIIV